MAIVQPGLIQELRVVFDACDCDEDGRISLSELANMSRTHTENNQVEQLLEIFNLGQDTQQDKVTFNQFVQRMVAFMNSNNNVNEKMPETKDMSDGEDDEEEDDVISTGISIRELNRKNSASHFSPNISGQGAFNENLKRSFEKSRSSVTSSPNNAASKVIKRKPSQSKLAGNIPLVNTSSEDEAEDSFDRKIASSLAFARPIELQPPQFLNRGSSLRTTVVRKQKSNPSSPNNMTSPSSQRMYPAFSESTSSRSSTSLSDCSATPSPTPSSKGQTKLMLKDLERQVEKMTDDVVLNKSLTNRKEEFESLSSGESLKADLESSIQLARKHGDERLEFERRRHLEEVSSLEKERCLERRNFQLKFEQIQEERDKLNGEVKSLRDKVDLLSMEKTLLEEQMMENVNKAASKEEEGLEEEIKRKDREEELLNTVKTLSERVASQDNQLAEMKEDNHLLKKQLKEMSVKETKNTGFRIFGSSKENICSNSNIDDPQDLRARLKRVEKQLQDQIDANTQMKHYMGDVLVNVMANNPQILEKNN